MTGSMCQQLLDQNQGFKTATSYSARNIREDRTYEIRDGALHIRARGKTSAADSRYDQSFIADDEQTKRFLKNNWHALNTDGLE